MTSSALDDLRFMLMLCKLAGAPVGPGNWAGPVQSGLLDFIAQQLFRLMLY